MRSLWIIAMLTLPACTSLHQKSKDTEFYSALSPKPVASFHQEYSEADLAFFRFLRECMPSPGKDDLVMNSTPFEIEDLLLNMTRTLPGGFIFIEGEDPQVYRIMKNWHFSRLPFNWRTYAVYRKPLEASA